MAAPVKEPPMSPRQLPQIRLPAGRENRGAQRSALFLTASIEGASARCPVLIRNISESGALLEGLALPPTGATVTLKRPEVEVVADVIWVTAPYCGVKFDRPVAVSAWIA